MNESAPTWSTLRELVSMVFEPRQLKRTVSVTQEDGVGHGGGRYRLLRDEPARRHPCRACDRAGLGEGRVDLPDAVPRLEFRTSVGHSQKCRPCRPSPLG